MYSIKVENEIFTGIEILNSSKDLSTCFCTLSIILSLITDYKSFLYVFLNLQSYKNI